MVRERVSREDIVASIPAYAEGSKVAVQRKVERDLDHLRGCGYPIATDSANRYFYDRGAPLLANVSALDVGLLRSILTGIRSSGPLLNAANSGLNKVLAFSPAESAELKYLQANIPAGDSALFLARAIQNRQRVSFHYESTSRAGSRTYELEPAALAEHFDAYFVSGPGREHTGAHMSWRTFRTTRIDESSLHVTGPATSAVAEPTESVFSYTDVILAIRPGCAGPLVGRGHGVQPPDGAGWPHYLYRELSRNQLFETLATYGKDVRIVAPEAAVTEWNARLHHLASLGGHHG